MGRLIRSPSRTHVHCSFLETTQLLLCLLVLILLVGAVGVVSSGEFSESNLYSALSYTYIQFKFAARISRPISWSSSLLELAGWGLLVLSRGRWRTLYGRGRSGLVGWRRGVIGRRRDIQPNYPSQPSHPTQLSNQTIQLNRPTRLPNITI